MPRPASRCEVTPILGVGTRPLGVGTRPLGVGLIINNMSSSDKGGLVKSSSSAGLVLAKDPLLLLKHKDKPKIAVEEEEFTEV